MKSLLVNSCKSFIVCLLFFVASAAVAQVPKRPVPQVLANDLAGIFSPRELSYLERKVVAFADSTSNQIAIVVVPELYGYDKAELAYEIGEQWGVGQSKFDNGIVILVKPKVGNSSGEVFIATGYGLEGVVTDAFARRVIEGAMIPYFRNGDYFRGINAALDYLMPVISGEISTKEFASSEEEGSAFAAGVFLFFMGIFIFLLATSSKGNNRNMGGGNNRGGRDFTAADAFILGSILGNATGTRGRSGGFGGGFGGGSFGGGGFGGFGGGSFGGGGAGGSW